MLGCRATSRLLSSLQRCYSSPAVVVPTATNEPLLTFAKGSEERRQLQKVLADLSGHVEEIPCVIGGKEVFSGNIRKQVAPFDHKRVIANIHYASKEMIKEAIGCALAAREKWDNTPFEHRAAILLTAADLLSTKYRNAALATTMLGQAKTAHQAEIDATCELIDFWRFGVQYAQGVYQTQPTLHSQRVWNRLVFRGLEGFVASISPFNFTAIGGNLSASPALMGNVVLWKPSDTATLSNWTVFKILREAGVPDGVINFVPAHGPDFGDQVTASADLAAVNFTGSARTFKLLWKQIGEKIDHYRTFPKFVGECGGKNYHLVHPSADIESMVNCTVRGAFEFSGQKCSATSRLYVPQTLWPKIQDLLVSAMKELKVGSPEDFSSFTSSVIDEPAFDRIASYLEFAKSSSDVSILAGGNADKSVGYFVEPTILLTSNPKNRLMEEEIFGPVLTVYVYPDAKWEQTLDLVNETSPYGLTGSVFAQDRHVVEESLRKLRHSAGNFYVNDKSTGSVVGQQPFGGSRLSGTNDKAGAPMYFLKWTSAMAIKETFVPCTEWGYPSVDRQ